MSDIIKLLPDNVANQIAAGEVVQRPASAVKELLENSVDAGADKIKLIVKDAGKTLIQVIDNGKGMSVIDARMSFERHATSKISCADDLFNLDTKGFRGEALASIAAISQVDLKTKTEGDDLATNIKIEGSKVLSQEPCTSAKGSNISVKNLFFNIPARRNFLKSDKAETKHIIDEFIRVAMAHPNIEFSLSHNSNALYNLEKSSLKIRIDSIFGSKSKDKFFPIEEETEIVTLKGFIAKPEYSKKRRGEQYFFVNNRFVKSTYLNHSVTAAFEGLISSDSFPSYFIFLEVDPQTIDINIHPTKTEIKFEDERSIYAILRSTIKHSLGQYNISPSLDFSIDGAIDNELMTPSDSLSQPSIEVDPSFNPFESENTKSSGSNYRQNDYQRKNTNANWNSLYSGLESLSPEDSFLISKTNDINTDNIKWEEEVKQSSLNQEEDFINENSSKYYQAHKRFILSHIRSGLIYIDQNRAHERILYDEFYTNFSQDNFSSQQLLFPLELELNQSQWIQLQIVIDDLQKIGFSFDEYTSGVIKIKGIPINFSEKQALNMVDKILLDLESAESEVIDNKLHTLALSYSRSRAVKAGVELHQKEMADLFNKLFACPEHNYSPSGKLISSIIAIEDIESRFN